MPRIKHALAFAASLVWPPTKAKLHRLTSYVGTAFAAFAVFEVWYASLGLTTGGKIGATLGMLATYAASWNAMRPRLDKVIDDLPIPDGTEVTQTQTTTSTTETVTTVKVPEAAAVAKPVSPEDALTPVLPKLITKGVQE